MPVPIKGRAKASSHIAIEPFKRIWVYTGLTCMTIVALINFLMLLALTPVKYFVSAGLYRHLTTILLDFAVPGFLCVPFSWAGCKVRCNGLGYMRDRAQENMLVLSNHSARVDWVIGLFIGTYYYTRVGFVTEAFVLLLPIVGWFRMLCEDMFVFRSFKKDKERLEENIDAFHSSGVKRWVFLSPEGMIADFSDFDRKYVEDCRSFCESRGMKPFDMCLTPRYKGITVFNKLVTKGEEKPAVDLSVTMTYVQDGERLVKPLSDDTRIIPDLWNILKGGLRVDVSCHLLELSNEPTTMRDQLMQEYADKDALLKHFYEQGRYPRDHPSVSPAPHGWAVYHDENVPVPADEADAFQTVPVQHLRMNVSMLSQLGLLAYLFLSSGYRVTLAVLVAAIWGLIASSHIFGQLLANGQSRESLPFEGCTKAIYFRMSGREGADGQEAEPATVRKAGRAGRGGAAAGKAARAPAEATERKVCGDEASPRASAKERKTST